MSEAPASEALRNHFQVLFTTGTAIGLSDRDLLERFLDQDHDTSEIAFKTLVDRHGAMVFRVCNQGLCDPHAAEDAFQVTFLVLARQARSIRKQDELASWLFGVACRAASRIRMMEARRQIYERRGAIARARATPGAVDPSEPGPELHAEIARLPEKYRVPIVLCYFEGLTHEQAAERLGWPLGTVKTRLTRARDQLRRRLERRGWLPAPLLGPVNLRPPEITDVPNLLLHSTTRAATAVYAGPRADGAIATGILSITNGILKTMLLRKIRRTSITLFAIAALGLGALAIARQSERKQGAAPSRTTDTSQRPVLSLASKTSATSVRNVYSSVDCRIDRVMVELGSRVKKGDPLLVLVSQKLAEEKNRYAEARSQWRRASATFDRKLSTIDRSKPLTKEFLEAKNWVASLDFEKMSLELTLSNHGLTEDDIANVPKENDAQKARMVLRAPEDGFVFKRDAVPGNFYDSLETLLVIARDDELTITGILDPRDAGKIRVGQKATVQFPDGERTFEARVQVIMPDPDSDRFFVQTSIPNLDHRLKAGLSARITVALGVELQSEHRNPVPAKQKTDSSLEERLSEVERKLDNFLQDSEKPSSSTEILKRLSDVERKLDRLLEPRPPK